MIGKKIKGFKFESTKDCYYHPAMNAYIDKIGIIDNESTDSYRIIFNDFYFWYPKDLCLQHLVEENHTHLLHRVDDGSKLVINSKVPTHYQTGNGFDVIDFCKMYDLNFNLGNVVKYCARAGKKDDIIKDLKKALDYLQREIKHLEL